MSNLYTPLWSNTTNAYLYNHLVNYFLVWYLPLVIGIGFAGSIFCLTFLIFTNPFPASMRYWLVCVCLGDFAVLFLEGLWMLLKVWLDFDLRDINTTWCILHTTLSQYVFYWSAYMQCMLSLRRCAVIWWPLRFKEGQVNKKLFLLLVTVISVILFIPIIPYPLFWRVIKKDCDPQTKQVYPLTTLLDLIFWGIVPFALMATSTGIIWHNLIQRNKAFQQTEAPSEGGQTAGVQERSKAVKRASSTWLRRLRQNRQASPSEPASVDPPVDHGRTDHDTRSRKSSALPRIHGTVCGQRRIAGTLIAMNSVYMASVYPLLMYFIFRNFIYTSVDDGVHRFVYYLCRSLCFLNACSNWIFYFVVGQTFRKRIAQTWRALVQSCRRNASGCGRRRISDTSGEVVVPRHRSIKPENLRMQAGS